MINPQEIILAIGPIVKGKPPQDIVEALFSCVATLVQLTSTFNEQDFVDMAREAWKFHEDKKKRETS
jgi:hypothetical protein